MSTDKTIIIKVKYALSAIIMMTLLIISVVYYIRYTMNTKNAYLDAKYVDGIVFQSQNQPEIRPSEKLHITSYPSRNAEENIDTYMSLVSDYTSFIQPDINIINEKEVDETAYITEAQEPVVINEPIEIIETIEVQEMPETIETAEITEITEVQVAQEDPAGASASMPVSTIPADFSGYGILRIPTADIDVKLYADDLQIYGAAQKIVDAKDSACIMQRSNVNPFVIADHKHQGFNRIKNLSVGDIVYVDTNTGTKTYYVQAVDPNGQNIGDIVDCNGNSIFYGNSNTLSLYTCNENWHHVTIVTCIEM